LTGLFGLALFPRSGPPASAQPPAEPERPAVKKEGNPAPGPREPGEIVIQGKVVDPEDRPVPGARIYSYGVRHIEEGGGTLLERATSKADGTFRCSFRKAAPGEDQPVHFLVAVAPGFGP